jgi:hypothetical protein
MNKAEPSRSPSDQAPTTSREWPENMRPRKAAEYLGLSQAFLDQSRCSGTGPKFVRVSRTCILYRKTDLDFFLASRLFTSTAEADRRGREHEP